MYPLIASLRQPSEQSRIRRFISSDPTYILSNPFKECITFTMRGDSMFHRLSYFASYQSVFIGEYSASLRHLKPIKSISFKSVVGRIAGYGR